MADIDPITFEVIRNALLTAAAEMKVVVMRSSYSTIWRESGDLSCALRQIPEYAALLDRYPKARITPTG